MKYFKYNYLTFLVSIVLFMGMSSCKTSKGLDAYKPLDKNLLWEISGSGIKKPSYLYGTIHIIEGKDFFLPKGTMAAFDAAKKVIFEIDMKKCQISHH